MAGFHKVAGSSAGVDRHPNDFYPTPRAVTRCLLAHETFPGPVLEPCAGKGHIVRELERAGYPVLANEKYPQPEFTKVLHEDFLVAPSGWWAGCGAIVTNPPYRLAQEFIERAIDIRFEKHAWLLRFQFIESKRRHRLFQDYPPSRIWVFPERVQVSEQGLENPRGGMIVYAWFVWERGYRGHPELRWFAPGEVAAMHKED